MSMFKFLPGILVVQATTVAMVFAVMGTSRAAEDWLPFAVVGVIVAVFAALWFGSIADHVRKDALADVAENHARERESLLVAAESDKRAALEETHRRIVRETARARGHANLKLGLGLLALLSLGGIMVAIEFMTLGFLILGTAGGALGGYLTRVRQERLALQRDAPVAVLEPPYDAARTSPGRGVRQRGG